MSCTNLKSVQFDYVFEKEIAFQVCNIFDLQDLNSGMGDRVVDQYKASYNPHHPAHQPKMFNSQAANQEGQLDRLQREFLDSTQRES